MVQQRNTNLGRLQLPQLEVAWFSLYCLSYHFCCLCFTLHARATNKIEHTRSKDRTRRKRACALMIVLFLSSSACFTRYLARSAS